MATYKDEKRGTWYCKFYYVDWTGTRRQKLKRGFKLQREAKEWERLFLEQFAKNPDITFEALYEKYKEYIRPRIRESTAAIRFHTIEKHILPFFKKKIVSDIAPADVSAWQTDILSKGLSDSYMRTINIYLKAIFTYAVEYLNLPKNPCTKPIGSTKSRKLNFWTPEEYKLFSAAISGNLEYFTIFETLYYTGMREGELLALTLNDIDFERKQIRITKTFYRITGKDLINPPKTAKSNRTIDIPGFLADEILEYTEHLYKLEPAARLFPYQSTHLRRALKGGANKANVKQIRLHDIRHSHASLLIDLGANPLLIADRLGHESPAITMNTYSHLFKSHQDAIIEKLEAAVHL